MYEKATKNPVVYFIEITKVLKYSIIYYIFRVSLYFQTVFCDVKKILCGINGDRIVQRM